MRIKINYDVNKENFFKYGYCVIKNFLNSEEIENYTTIIEELHAKNAPRRKVARGKLRARRLRAGSCAHVGKSCVRGSCARGEVARAGKLRAGKFRAQECCIRRSFYLARQGRSSR